MHKNLCVFCSSSNSIEKKYFAEANKLALLLVKTDCSLVFGGGTIGLMGEIARIFHTNKKNITSVIPKKLNKKGIVFEDSTKIIETETMNERKLIMQNLSDAFIILPGGFGTFEEMLEVVTSKQLAFHDKPIVILNTGGFFNSLFEQFEKLAEEKFIDARHKNLYYISNSVEDIIAYLDNYKPVKFDNKLPFM